MSTRIDQYNSTVSNGSPTSPAPSQQSFPPRSSSMRQLPHPSVTIDTPIVSLEAPLGFSYAQFLRVWSDDHVARWLADNKCGHLAQTFSQHDIRGDILLELEQSTLKEMGITSIGDRLRIMNALKSLRQKCSARAPLMPITDSNRSASHSRTSSTTESGSSPISKPGGRRLDAGRPTPITIPRETPHNLPRVDRPIDSARRPLPLPTPTTATPQAYSNGSGSSGGGSTPQDRNGLHTPISQMARTPIGQGQQPSRTTTPSRTTVRGAGYRTPGANEVNNYNNTPLPPAPGPPPAYGLPSDPRPGNLGGSRTPVRAASPLSSGSRERTNALSPDANSAHARNTSLDRLMGISSSSKAQRTLGLTVPPAPGVNLSPIVEGFASTPGAGRVSPPSATDSASRSQVPLAVLLRKLLKFSMPEQGQTRTIDVSNAAGGLDVLERAIRKFGVINRQLEANDYAQTADGGLVVDGWSAFLEWNASQAANPLTETDLLSLSHAQPGDPAMERVITLRRVSRGGRRGYENLGLRQSPTSPRFAPNDDLGVSQYTKNMRRASSISILSGLGVTDPERVLEPTSPTQLQSMPDTPTRVQPPTPDAIPPEVPPKPSSPGNNRLHAFPGQRPPSELVTTHITAYFPGAEKKVLERARRMTMLRPQTGMYNKRDSIASFATGGSRPNPRFSRYSMSTQGSGGVRPGSPSRSSTISGISGISNEGSAPRVSLSTEDGRSIDLQPTAPEYRRADSRQSIYSQYRGKKDVSDTASLMTVDQITAEVVESRRSSTLINSESGEGWTKVGEEGESEELTPSEDLEEEDEEEEEEEEEDWAEGSRWVKGALIGAGSFGQVYLGMDTESGILMAVKQVELPKEDNPNAERKKAMLTALEHEIALLEELQHQHIVQYLHSAIDEEYLNIFLEYVPGGSITALLSNYGAFEETLVKTFLRQILRGLDYLHGRDIIHRDIKGANILVDNKGTVKISDFGISKKGGVAVAGGGRGHRPSLQGSVFWMAPEVVKQSAHTPKADIWSVGCLVVEMFTGQHPWANLTQMQAIFKIGSSAKPVIPTDISQDAQDFLALTFNLDYDKRPSAAECLQHPWLAVQSKKGGSKLKPPPAD